jgi:conjugal transfer/type IV secretion protein DotA/TraY
VASSKNSGMLAKQAIDTVGSTIADGLMQSIIEKELCRATVSTMKIRGMIWDDNAAPATSPTFKEPSYTAAAVGYFSKNEVYTADYGKICGSLEISVPKAANIAPSYRTEYGIDGKERTVAVDSSVEDNRAHQIGIARLNAVKGLQQALAPIAAKAAATYQVGTQEGKSFSDVGALTYSEITQAKQDYLKGLGTSIQMNLDMNNSANSGSIMQKMKDDAIASGWAKSGTYYLTISRIQSNLYSSLFGGVKASPLTMEATAGVSKSLGEYLFGINGSPGVIPQYRVWWGQNIGQISGDASANLAKAGSNSVFDSISDFSLWTGSIFMHLDVNPLNPMGAMIEYGDFLMRTGFGIYIGIQAIENGSALLGSAGLAMGTGGSGVAAMALTAVATVSSAAFKALATPLTIVAGAIIMAGAVHSYVIPLMPYILTLFFISGMLILTVESLVAAPLWAFFHIRLDGQEFIDQVQKPGYMIAFNLLLRPVLMIFGLILSMLTFGAMAWFVNETFMPVANGLAASTTIGPIGAAVLVVMLGVINLNLANKSFHLITDIPDRVTRWFGQGGERLNEENDSTQLKGAVLGAVTGRGESAIRAVMTSKMINGAGGDDKGAPGRGNDLANAAKGNLPKPGGATPGSGKPAGTGSPPVAPPAL